MGNQAMCTGVHVLRGLVIATAILTFATWVLLGSSCLSRAATIGVAFVTVVCGSAAIGVAESIDVAGGRLDGGFIMHLIGTAACLLGIVAMSRWGKASSAESTADEGGNEVTDQDVAVIAASDVAVMATPVGV